VFSKQSIFEKKTPPEYFLEEIWVYCSSLSAILLLPMEQQFRYFISLLSTEKIHLIGEILSQDHAFINPLHQYFDGKHDAEAAWNNYLGYFPDFKIEVFSLMPWESRILAECEITGSWKGEKQFNFKESVIIKSGVAGNIIGSCQFFGDPKSQKDIIQSQNSMATVKPRVTGLGGVFFQSKEPKALCAWYDEHLGTNFGNNTYSYFTWRDREDPEHKCTTTYSIFNKNSEYFAPGKNSFMLNFRVTNLDKLIQNLSESGIENIGEIQRLEYGNFGWIMDPEGNKIELWEPHDAVLEAYEESQKG
jgi:predicted enzyme related to lactoylglutathione lyase